MSETEDFARKHPEVAADLREIAKERMKIYMDHMRDRIIEIERSNAVGRIAFILQPENAPPGWNSNDLASDWMQVFAEHDEPHFGHADVDTWVPMISSLDHLCETLHERKHLLGPFFKTFIAEGGATDQYDPRTNSTAFRDVMSTVADSEILFHDGIQFDYEAEEAATKSEEGQLLIERMRKALEARAELVRANNHGNGENQMSTPTITDIARATHEANRAYCEALGDTSQVPWEDAPEWQRDSAIAGVTSIVEGRSMSPAHQHKEWCEYKRADGWVYGVEKDPVKKTHPCLVPYTDLPAQQRGKDHLFRAVVLGLLGKL